MNKNIAVAILDNASENRLLLKELLIKNFPTIQSVLLFSDPSDFIKSLRINSYEIVFLSDSIKNNSTNEDIPVFVKLIVPNLILITRVRLTIGCFTGNCCFCSFPSLRRDKGR